ncbi:hypothetical protein EalM132_00165 [Exiguobacterium phage vB_EalM-132]|nr:hypothetical protein EalM132_00165 [Exiguobacterium phage vB_EalM-132]
MAKNQPTAIYSRTINLHPHQVCQWTMKRIPLGVECVLMTYDYGEGMKASRMLDKDAVAVQHHLEHYGLKYEGVTFQGASRYP